MKFLKSFAIWMWIGLGAVNAILIAFYFSIGIENSEIIKLAESSYVGTIVGGFTSVIAVILLYITYLSQQKELRETQKALHQQKIDSAFFEMLALLQEIVRSMSDTFSLHQGGEERREGRNYLRSALAELKETHMARARINMRPNSNTGTFNSFQPSIQVLTENEADRGDEIVNEDISVTYHVLLKEVAEMYESFYRNHQQNLGHYFRYVYNIIKYVIDPANRLSEPDQERYLGILQAQLSNDEMGLIFYDALSKHGRTSTGKYRFRNWLDEYSMLENMDRQSLKHEWHQWFFPKTVFKFLNEQERERKTVYVQNIASFNIPQ